MCCEASLWDSKQPMETKRHGAIVDDAKKRANWGELRVILTSVD
mgnify:CR=1 FL=1